MLDGTNVDDSGLIQPVKPSPDEEKLIAQSERLATLSREQWSKFGDLAKLSILLRRYAKSVNHMWAQRLTVAVLPAREPIDEFSPDPATPESAAA